MAFIASTKGHYYHLSSTGVVTPRHDADLRIARREGLFSSVSTITKAVRANDAILRYIKEQLVRAVEANPRWAGESDDDYHKRVDGLANRHKEEAANAGTALHKAAEFYPAPPSDPALQPFMDEFGPWYDEHIECVWHREKELADPRIGVGGTVDFVGVHRQHGPIIIDWKGRSIKEGKKPEFYVTQAEQLAFYSSCYTYTHGLPECPRIMSVLINRDYPMRPIERLWTKEESVEAWRRFLATVYIYQSQQKLGGFFPSGRWHPKELWDSYN